MEAKELMIGDWVKCTDPIPMQITAIDSWDMVVEDQEGLKVEIGDLQPIPLTEEMLMLNGFEKYPWDNSAVQFVFLDEEALIHYGSGIFCYKENTSIKIKYVHELQHLLRLCELNELADNFKIE